MDYFAKEVFAEETERGHPLAPTRQRALCSALMTPPLDKPSPEAPAPDAAAHAWLDALKAEIDATTPAEWLEIGRREESIKRAIEEIEAGHLSGARENTAEALR